MVLQGRSGVVRWRLDKMRELLRQHETGRGPIEPPQKKTDPIEQLEYLRHHAPDKFEAAAQVIKVLRDSLPKGVHPGVAAGVDKVLPVVEEIVDQKRER